MARQSLLPFFYGSVSSGFRVGFRISLVAAISDPLVPPFPWRVQD